MKLEHEHYDTRDETLFYTIDGISFSHNYRIEKSAVQVYILPSVFITIQWKGLIPIHGSDIGISSCYLTQQIFG
jgi:hypothetical protein